MPDKPIRYERWTVDHLDGKVARCEIDGAAVNLPRWVLPAEARAGDLLKVRHEREGQRSRLTIVRDEEGTREAMESSRRQLARSEPTGKGDIVL